MNDIMYGRKIIQLVGANENIATGFSTFKCGDVNPVVCASQIFSKDDTAIVIASEHTMFPQYRLSNPCNEYPLNKIYTTHHFTCNGVLWWIMTYGEELPMAVQQKLITICGNGYTFTRYSDAGLEELLELIQPLKAISNAPALHGMKVGATRVTTVCADTESRILELLRIGDGVARPVLIADESTVTPYLLAKLESMVEGYSKELKLTHSTINSDRVWVFMQVIDDDDIGQVNADTIMKIERCLVDKLYKDFN